MRTAILTLTAALLIAPALWALDPPAYSKADSYTFKVGADCKIVGSDEKGLTLADLKTGEKVVFAYKKDNDGTLVAHRIHIGNERKTETPPAKGEKKGKMKVDDLLHMQGVITAVDTTARTVTVDRTYNDAPYEPFGLRWLPWFRKGY